MSERNAASITWTAGAIAALAVDAVVFPLDTLKTRLQAPDYADRFTNRATGAVNRAALFRGLYQGVGSIALAMIPSSGAFFVTYDSLVSTLSSHDWRTRFMVPMAGVHAAASSIAEAVSCAILTPAEVLKQNAQMLADSSGYSSSLQAWRQLRSNPLNLLRGYTAMLTRNLPTTAINFPLFEALRRSASRWWLARRESRHGDGAVNHHRLPVAQCVAISAASAACSGGTAAFVVTPIDVAKTRTMLQPRQSSRLTGSSRGLVATLRQIHSEAGVRGLYRGAPLRAIWAAIGTGLYLSTYEWAKQVLRQRQQMWSRRDCH